MNGPQHQTPVAGGASNSPSSGSARTRTRTLSNTTSAIDTSPQALYKHQKHLQPDQQGIPDPGSPSTQALDKIMFNLAEQHQLQQQQQQHQQLHHYHQQHQQHHLQQQHQYAQAQSSPQRQPHLQQQLQLNSSPATMAATIGSSSSSTNNLKRDSISNLQTLAPQLSQPSSLLSHPALSSDASSSTAAHISSPGNYTASVGSDNLNSVSVSGHHLPQGHHHLTVPHTPPPHTTSFGITGDASGSAINNTSPLQHRPHTPLRSSFPSSISSDLPESPSATINFDAVPTNHTPSPHYKPFSTTPGRKHPMGSEKHQGSLPTIHYQNGRGRQEGMKTFMGVSMKHLSLVVLLLQNSTLVLMMRYSRVNVDPDQPLYLASTAVFFAELIKLLACVSVMLYTTKSLSRTFYILRKEILEQPKEIAKMLVPSGLYALQNNLLYIALSNLEAATFQVTYQMKILSTALFSVVMLGRRLTRQKWLALVLLMIGVTLVQLQNVGSSKPSPVIIQEDSDELDTDVVDLAGGESVVETAEEETTSPQNPIIGLLAVVTSCVSSGFAGCYFEKILKGSETDMWVRNIQLGISGSLFSFLAMFYDRQKIYEGGLLQGYSTITWVVVFNQALGGLLVAIVVKYADNILKGFATSLSIIISGIISVYFFDFEPSMQFQIGTLVVILATFLYGRPDAPLPGSMFGIRREKKRQSMPPPLKYSS